SFASHALESLVALARDPIAPHSWLASGLFSLQVWYYCWTAI
ncbi:hypothetical protein A2U01_0076433, partial [Trifolium medium]|nr:hypothetical protein [Trifolium medium]